MKGCHRIRVNRTFHRITFKAILFCESVSPVNKFIQHCHARSDPQRQTSIHTTMPRLQLGPQRQTSVHNPMPCLQVGNN